MYKSDEKCGNCYCGKDRNLNISELLCAMCSKWFHESCIGYQLGRLVPFMMNYVFVCKICSNSGLESFRKTQATATQMCTTTMANLQQASIKEGNARYFFSKDKDILPYMDHYWEAMTTMSRKSSGVWGTTVYKALLKDANNLFQTSENGEMFGLTNKDVTKIKPNYSDESLPSSQIVAKGRQPKRKLVGADSGPTSKKKSDIGSYKFSTLHGYPLEHPFNKDGYRYILAEPDPHAPFRQEFDESSDWAGKPIPGWLYRVLSPNNVLIALHDRAPQLKVSEDRLSITGDKGYCMARATHYVSKGAWYWEATVEDMPDGSACRLGWGQEYANLQAPLGYDKFGYSWRSRKGTKFHESHGKHYSPGYGEGDTLGFLIILPEAEKITHIPNTYKDRPLVKFKSHLYYEDKDKVNDTLKNLKVLPGSKIIFFKNGKCQGEAFVDIHGGGYYPAISLHKNATISVNFGPNFKHPHIEDEFKCRGMYERVEDLICEQTMADMLYLTENDGKLRLDSYCV